MFIVAVKKTDGTNAEIANASAEYAFRVMSKITGARLYSNTNTWVMRVPNKLGDMDIVRKYFIYEPKYIRTDNDIPNESEGVNTYKSQGGSKDTMGYGFIKDVLDEHYISYDIIDVMAL